MDELLENTWYTISHYIVWSDFYRLSGNTESAIKYVESAKEVLDAHNLKTAPLYEKELGKLPCMRKNLASTYVVD